MPRKKKEETQSLEQFTENTQDENIQSNKKVKKKNIQENDDLSLSEKLEDIESDEKAPEDQKIEETGKKTKPKKKSKKVYQIVRIYRYVYEVTASDEYEALQKSKEIYVGSYKRMHMKSAIVNDDYILDF